MVSEAARERILGAVERGLNEGAELVVDGRETGPSEGCFIGATILDGRHARDGARARGDLRPGAVAHPRRDARRGDRGREQEPLRQRRVDLHRVGRRGAQVQARRRGRHGGREHRRRGPGRVLPVQRAGRTASSATCTPTERTRWTSTRARRPSRRATSRAASPAATSSRPEPPARIRTPRGDFRRACASARRSPSPAAPRRVVRRSSPQDAGLLGARGDVMSAIVFAGSAQFTRGRDPRAGRRGRGRHGRRGADELALPADGRRRSARRSAAGRSSARCRARPWSTTPGRSSSRGDGSFDAAPAVRRVRDRIRAPGSPGPRSARSGARRSAIPHDARARRDLPGVLLRTAAERAAQPARARRGRARRADRARARSRCTPAGVPVLVASLAALVGLTRGAREAVLERQEAEGEPR